MFTLVTLVIRGIVIPLFIYLATDHYLASHTVDESAEDQKLQAQFIDGLQGQEILSRIQEGLPELCHLKHIANHSARGVTGRIVREWTHSLELFIPVRLVRQCYGGGHRLQWIARRTMHLQRNEY